MVKAGPGDFFGVQVVDEDSGRGIPMATLETVNGVHHVTDSMGWAAFQEPGLMDRKVFFNIRSPGYAMQKDNRGFAGASMTTTPGTTAQIKLLRTDIAERLYRVTGQGIYRDTTLLGREAPLPQPNLQADVLGVESVQSVLFNGKIFWTWRDVHQAAYPVGHSQGIAATSDLPDNGGLHPSLGVHFKYFLNSRGDGTRAMMPNAEPGAVWLDGLLVVKGGDGPEKLIAHYSRMRDAATRLEHGLVEFNEQTGVFEQVVMLGEEFQWQCPRGHAVRVGGAEGDWFYFADPFCHTRVKADYDSVMNPSAYESLVYSSAIGAYEWKPRLAPQLQSEEEEMVRSKRMPESAARYAVVDVASARPVHVSGASIRWSDFRKRWIMIATEANAQDLPTGEVWYAESEAADGPWRRAVKIVSLPDAGFLAPDVHPFFDQEGGRVIFFEGTHTPALIKKSQVTPRYDQNQLMYRLDLSDRRMKAAQK